MATPERLSLSGVPCSERYEDRDEAFRKLLCEVSQRLSEDDVQQMEFIVDLPERPKNGLGLLMELHKRGRFSPKRTEPLSKLLKDVNRHDLAGKLVDEYRTAYPEIEGDPVTHPFRERSRCSLPPAASPRLVQRRKRANTDTDARLRRVPQIVVDQVSEKSLAGPHLAREASVRQEVRSQCAAQQVNPSLLHLPSSNRDVSLQQTALYHGRSHSYGSSNSRSLSQYPAQFESANSPPHATSPSSPSTPSTLIPELGSSPQVPGRNRHSTASTPDHSHRYLGGEGNSADSETHSLHSSSASSVHIHVHLPHSHSRSFEVLPSAASHSHGGKADSPRLRLGSAPEQYLRPDNPHRHVGVSYSVPSHMHSYQQSDEQRVNCSSEQLQSSPSQSEELVSSGGRPLTLLIDGQQGKRERPGENRESFMSDKTLTPASPRVSKHQDSGKHDQEEETKQCSVKGASQPPLDDAHHRPANRSQRLFKRLSRSIKREPQTLPWTIFREEASEMVWKHEEQGCMRCPRQLQVDARCGDSNPHLMFRLHPYGLFEDKGKNMTLFVKTIIPDDCPPIHPSTKFYLTVRVCAVDGKERKTLHVHRLEPKLNSCVLYIPKIMSHKQLQKIKCRELNIEISASTGC